VGILITQPQRWVKRHYAILKSPQNRLLNQPTVFLDRMHYCTAMALVHGTTLAFEADLMYQIITF